MDNFAFSPANREEGQDSISATGPGGKNVNNFAFDEPSPDAKSHGDTTANSVVTGAVTTGLVTGAANTTTSIDSLKKQLLQESNTRIKKLEASIEFFRKENNRLKSQVNNNNSTNNKLQTELEEERKSLIQKFDEE